MNTLIVACPSCKTKNKMSAGKQHHKPRCGKCQTPLPMAGHATPVELGSRYGIKALARLFRYGSLCRSCHSNDKAVVPRRLTDQDAAQVIREADLPLMLDLYSPGCTPCRTLAPVIDKLARFFFGRAIIAKIDTSTNHLTARQYGIRGVPTLIFLKNGQVVDQVVGALPEDALVAKLNSFIRA